MLLISLLFTGSEATEQHRGGPESPKLLLKSLKYEIFQLQVTSSL